MTADETATTSADALLDRELKTATRAMWASGDYHRFAINTVWELGPILVEACGIEPGQRVLDVAAGTGNVAIRAAEAGARVIASDLTPENFEAGRDEARKRGVQLEWVEADAEKLPFADESFDAVTISFGMLHFAAPERALAEAHRVLRPGGRIGFTVWAPPAESRGFGLVLGAIQKHGDMNVPLPPGPSFFRFSEEAECRRVLLEARFTAPQFRKLPQTWRLDSPQALFEVLLGSTVRTGALLRAQTPKALDAIRAEIGTGAVAYRKDGGIEVPMPAVLASATKGSS